MTNPTTNTDLAATVASLKAQVATAAVANFPQLVQQLSAVGVNLVEGEAEAFGTLVTGTVQAVEAGQSPLAAFKANLPAFEAASSSDLATAAKAAAQDFVAYLDNVWQAIKGAL